MLIHDETPKRAFGIMFVVSDRVFVPIHDEKSKRPVGMRSSSDVFKF